MPEREKSEFELTIEDRIGMPIEEMQATSVDGFRCEIEKKYGEPMRAIPDSQVHRSRKDVESELDSVIGKEDSPFD